MYTDDNNMTHDCGDTYTDNNDTSTNMSEEEQTLRSWAQMKGATLVSPMTQEENGILMISNHM
jgi:hypothetical protein